MTFKEFQKICEKQLHTVRLADIARELDVTPQVINNWKTKNQVPHKYVKIIRKKIKETNDASRTQSYDQVFHPGVGFHQDDNDNDSLEVLISVTKKIFFSIKNNLIVFFLIPSMIICVSLFKVLSLDPIYVSTAKIIPTSSSSSSSGQLQSLASNFGISMGNSKAEGLTSADLFPQVIKSRRLLRSMLKRKFNTIRYGDDKPLISILSGVLDINAHNEDLMKMHILGLGGIIDVFPDKNTTMILLRVSVFEKQLAADILQALIEELDKLQSFFKTSRIKEKKNFIEARIFDVEKELIKSEEALKYFRETNRNIMKSPSLMLSQERLIREVSTHIQLYQTLKSQFEIAQIEFVEKSSMIDILDPPEAPVQRAGPNRRGIMIGVLIFSFIFSTSIVFGIYMYKQDNLFSIR